jgi:hypothetical protein
MSNNKQSSVEQFAIALYEKGLLIGNGDLIQTILDLHKAMHEEEIIDALLFGDVLSPTTAENYYNETFK